MILHVLPRGEMSFTATELVGYPRQLIHLRGRQYSTRNLRADHMHVGLALGIDSAPQALRAEFVDGQLTGSKLFGVGAKEFDVGANRGVVLGLGLLLRSWGFDCLGEGHAKYPLLYRDYYILSLFSIQEGRTRLVSHAV